MENPLIAKLTKYYGKAIRDNVWNAEAMANAVQATLYHVLSTDENPRHHLCPDGEDLWCFFKLERQKGNQRHTQKGI